MDKILTKTKGFFKNLFGNRRVSLDKRKARSGYLFVLPFILGIILIYLPILLDSISFSMTDYQNTVVDQKPVTTYTFVGLQYYKEAFEYPAFTESLLKGLQQLVFQVPAIIIFSLFIAVVLNQDMLGRAAFRAIFFVPVIISTGLMDSINASDIMSAAAQGGIDDGSGGAATSQIISVLDVKSLFAGMKVGGELVTYVVQIVNDVYDIINYSGVQMLIFLAGLQSISPSIYEACTIDGATAWETFWKITFPMISPMILVNGVYTIIDSFTRTTNPAMKFIQTTYDSRPMYATAMSWIYFLIVILTIAIVAGILSSFIFYQRRD